LSIADCGFQIGQVIRQVIIVVELVILSALILAARCANYQDVFVAGNVYFTDADCYARMTRARMCAEHPGLILRHHDFENFPAGTTPHTTAPFDYLIVGLSILLKPFTAYGLDFAGALISPLLALLGGWFLWFWSKRINLRYRWVLLILYALSPILVHGTELGRPDHQSLSILLVTIAICAEWNLRTEPSRNWTILSGFAWGLAIWVSAYEALILLLLTLVLGLFEDRQSTFGSCRRIGWIAFAVVVTMAFLVERRVPSLSVFNQGEIFKNWSRAIGELAHIPLLDPIWVRWAGYMIVVAPLLIWVGLRKRNGGASGDRALPYFILAVLVATYCLTIWQARWGYFFAVVFAILLPFLLEQIKSATAVWIAFALSIFPLLRDWDERLWPNESEYARRVEQRIESAQLRDLALSLRSPETRPFLAPWWISPEIAYWSAQPGVTGSSHESLDGIADSARFFLAEDWQIASEILSKHKTAWVLAYDSERVVQNSSAILGTPAAAGARSLSFVLDRTPARAPQFLSFSAQNGAGKLYRVVSNR
jgi:hypothetical protein